MPDGRSEMWAGLVVTMIVFVLVAACIGYAAGCEYTARKLHREAVKHRVGEWVTDMDGNVHFMWKRPMHPIPEPETDR